MTASRSPRSDGFSDSQCDRRGVSTRLRSFSWSKSCMLTCSADGMRRTDPGSNSGGKKNIPEESSFDAEPLNF